MPKRANPFGDNTPLQLKTHITQRNVDMGVDKMHNMQSVYERTQRLLYSGARQKCISVCEDDCSLARSSLPTKPLPGQMTLNSCGTLFSCQIAKQDSEMECEVEPMHCNNNSLPAATHQDHFSQMQIDHHTGHLVRGEGSRQIGDCHTCHNVKSSTAIQPCAYCDKATCVLCLRQCSQCAKIVCKLCSNVSFESGEDCVVCGDCMM